MDRDALCSAAALHCLASLGGRALLASEQEQGNRRGPPDRTVAALFRLSAICSTTAGVWTSGRGAGQVRVLHDLARLAVHGRRGYRRGDRVRTQAARQYRLPCAGRLPRQRHRHDRGQRAPHSSLAAHEPCTTPCRSCASLLYFHCRQRRRPAHAARRSAAVFGIPQRRAFYLDAASLATLALRQRRGSCGVLGLGLAGISVAKTGARLLPESIRPIQPCVCGVGSMCPSLAESWLGFYCRGCCPSPMASGWEGCSC